MSKIKLYLKKSSSISLVIFLFYIHFVNLALAGQSILNFDDVYGEFAYLGDKVGDLLVQAKLFNLSREISKQLKDGEFVIGIDKYGSQVLGKGCSINCLGAEDDYQKCDLACSFSASSIDRNAEFDVVWQKGDVKESVFKGYVSDFRIGNVERVEIGLEDGAPQRENLKFTIDNLSRDPLHISEVVVCDDVAYKLSSLVSDIKLPINLKAGEDFSFVLKLKGTVDDLSAEDNLCIRVAYGVDSDSVLDKYEIRLFKSDLIGVDDSDDVPYIIYESTFRSILYKLWPLVVPAAFFVWKFWPNHGEDKKPPGNGGSKSPPPDHGDTKPGDEEPKLPPGGLSHSPSTDKTLKNKLLEGGGGKLAPRAAETAGARHRASGVVDTQNRNALTAHSETLKACDGKRLKEAITQAMHTARAAAEAMIATFELRMDATVAGGLLNNARRLAQEAVDAVRGMMREMGMELDAIEAVAAILGAIEAVDAEMRDPSAEVTIEDTRIDGRLPNIIRAAVRAAQKVVAVLPEDPVVDLMSGDEVEGLPELLEVDIGNITTTATPSAQAAMRLADGDLPPATRIGGEFFWGGGGSIM